MTDIAGRLWPSVRPAFTRPALHPMRTLGRPVPDAFTRPRPDLEAARPSLSTSIDRWLALYLRAHL